MVLTVFGINYKFADLNKLEQISFSTEDITKSLSLLVSGETIKEGIIISTCNRIECYTACQEGGATQQILQDFIQLLKPVCTGEILDKFYYKEGIEAVEHLFSVVSGLDSLVIGENEIAGQLKEAYRTACDLKTTGILTNKLFHAAFRTSKRVKNETKINEGNCSVGCVAIDLAEQMFPEIQTCRVLLIGAGNIVRVVAQNLKNRCVENIFIANRSFDKALNLAEKIGGTAIPFHDIDRRLGDMDIVISGTGSPEYLFQYNYMETLLNQRRNSPLLIVDIALPRDFDPEIDHLPNVTLKNLYDLQEVVYLNIKKREQEIPKVKRIVAEEVQKFLSWRTALRIKPTIQALTENFETIRLIELEKQGKQFPDETFSQVEQFTKALTNKYIHLIIANLKSLHEICNLTPGQIHIIQHLFDSHGIFDEYTNCRFKRQQSGAEADPNGDRSSQ